MSSENWDDETDVVVVGCGAAGSIAAIEAADGGADVIAVDRFGRGGASARSGGVVYAGGGTPQQLAAGFADDAAQMERYLALEEGVAEGDPALMRFCERSSADLAWLRSVGVEFPIGFDPRKSVVPTGDETGLYFSGNEKHFAAEVPAVPRGHRVAGVGMTGRDLIEALHRAARGRGVDIRDRVRMLGLVTGDAGRVEGVEVLVIGSDPVTRAVHTVLYRLIDVAVPMLHRAPPALVAALDRWEQARGRVRRIRARHGVVLATGGFSFNRQMMVSHAPAYSTAMPLGTPGDDGSGLEAARRIGAATQLMDRCGASRFIAPPTTFCEGVLLDGSGERICDESLYAATLSARIAERDGVGWLVIDNSSRKEVLAQVRASDRLRSRSLRQLLTGRANHVVFPRLFGPVNLYLNRVVAPDLDDLARRCGVPAEALRATIERYNEVARAGGPDEMGKPSEYLKPLTDGPFAAVRCHLDGVIFPAPCITLGGLSVDQQNQRVHRADESEIDGLYAVGRCAAGVASRSYVSGLSLADCVHSGRNAGLAVTGRSRSGDAHGISSGSPEGAA